MLTCIPLALMHSHSCLNIHASHTANVCLLSISVNAVLSVFHDLFTHLNPLRTSIFNRGGSHVFPWLQNGYGMHTQHAQCVNAYFSVLSAAVTACEASLESNLESSDRTNIAYNLYFWGKQPFVRFVKVRTSQGLVFSSSNRWNWAVFVSFKYFISIICLAAFDLMLLLSVNRLV